jgi:hypothetical protein
VSGVVGCLSLVITCRNAGTQVSSNIHKDVRETVSRNRVSHVSAIGEGDAALAAGGGHNHHITGVAPHPHHPSQITLETPRPAHHQQRRAIAPDAPPRVLKRSPPLRRHPPRSPQPARLPHSSSRPLRSARSRRGQSFRRLSHSPTAPTAPPPRRPAWPATRKTRPNHAPAPPPPGTPRRIGSAHPQRRSPGCRSPQRLRRPPAAHVARRRLICPARPPGARSTGSGAPQRAPAPRASSPAPRLPTTTPWSLVTGCCLPGQALAARPCPAQPTPPFLPVRSSGRRPTRTKALESSGRGGPRCARRYRRGCGPTGSAIAISDITRQ